MEQNEIIKNISFNVIHGKKTVEEQGIDIEAKGQAGVSELIDMAIDAQLNPCEIIQESLHKPMQEVIQKFHNHEYMLPEVLACAMATEAAINRLKPIVGQSENGNKGKFVIATVKKDRHELGKNIVALLLKVTGYEVFDLGCDVSADGILEAVIRHQAPYIGLSCRLSSSRSEISMVNKKIEAENFRNQVKILVGGISLSNKFSKHAGADFFCEDVFKTLDLLDHIHNQPNGSVKKQ